MDVIEINRTTVMGASGPTFGKIYINGLQIGVTLEPEFMSGQLMSMGTYRAFLRISKKSGKMVIELKDTYPRTVIQIHTGSVVKHTIGCILVGSGHNKEAIWGSQEALNEIFVRLATPVNLQVVIR